MQKLSFRVKTMALTSDFRFWEERVPFHRQSSGDSSGDYIEFRVQKHHDQDESSTTDSPPLWTKTPKNSTLLEAKSPLLPHAHHYSSCLSPTSRSRAILEGKRELMEMIKDLPESSLELSLKDIVEDHADQVKEVVLVEEIKKTNNHKIGKRIIRRIHNNNNKNTTSSKICRTESMESGVFLLKMFLPASLISSKKRSDSRKWPTDNIGPPPPEGSETSQATSKWWKITFLFLRDYKNKRNIDGSMNSEINTRGENRLVDGSCRWWLCFHKKCSSSGQRECLLF